MVTEPPVLITTAKPMFPTGELLQLTPDEVRLELARHLAILMGVPTRVRGAQVEVLMGDTWVVHRGDN